MSLYLIFDFDGVIGDTYETSIASHLQYGSRSTRESAIAEMNEYFNKMPNHTRNHTKSAEEMTAMTKWTIEFGKIVHTIGFPLFDEFVKTIEAIDTPYKAIVSSGSHVYVAPALARTNINPTHTLAFEDHHSKEEKIESICRDWGVTPEDVYYFTDSLADVYELENFISPGKLIGVAWGFSGKENLCKELPEKYILDIPSDITKVLPQTF